MDRVVLPALNVEEAFNQRLVDGLTARKIGRGDRAEAGPQPLHLSDGVPQAVIGEVGKPVIMVVDPCEGRVDRVGTIVPIEERVESGLRACRWAGHVDMPSITPESTERVLGAPIRPPQNPQNGFWGPRSS